MANPNCEQESFAEVTVIDSQFQHFSSYIDVIRVFKCRLCTFCSPLEHVIASHMSEVHFPRRNYLCKQCLFVFEDRNQLTSHLESSHGTKSINVCFGDTSPNYASPPPPPPPPSWRATRSEDSGIARLSVGDERYMDEIRNGRVTSSTGNLANLRDDIQDSPRQMIGVSDSPNQVIQEPNGSPPSAGVTCQDELPQEHQKEQREQQREKKHRHSQQDQQQREQQREQQQREQQQREQQYQQQQQQASGSPIGKHLSNGSCNPSSSSHDDCEIVGTEPARELAPGETPIQRQSNQDYIKAEPISPVRRYFPPSISVDSPDQPQPAKSPQQQQQVPSGGISDPAAATAAKATGGVSNGPEKVVSRMSRMLNRSTTIALSPTDKGDVENELALARPVQPSFTSYIIRQSSFEVGEESSAGYPAGAAAPHPSNPSSDRARAVQHESSPTTVDQQRIEGQHSPVYKPRKGLSRRVMTIHRQDSIEEGRYGQVTAVRESEEQAASGAATATRTTAEVPAVTQTPPVTQAGITRNRSHRLTFREMANQMLESTEKHQRGAGGGADPSTPLSLDIGHSGPGAFPGGMSALQRAGGGRPRSFSISEGDTRALYSGLNSEYPAMAAVRVPGSDRDHNMPYSSHNPPRWHAYPGPMYQSLSVDAGAAKYWGFPNQRSLAPPEEASVPSPVAAPPPVPAPPASGTQPEDAQSTDPNAPPIEGSVLYQALQNNEDASSSSAKRRRNSFHVSSMPGIEGQHPSHASWQHPWAQRRGMSEISQRMPWGQGSPPYPMLGQNSIDSASMPSHQSSSDQHSVFLHKRFRSMERSASEGHNSTANPHRKVGGQGISSESSQDLAQADDITRQVQQVMEGSSTMYSARGGGGSTDKTVPIWTEEHQGQPGGQLIDPSDKDAELRRRSRKSTFNIYREIPERKRKLDRGEEEKIKNSYNPDGSFDYFTLTGWKAYKCDLCKKRRFKTASELEEHKRRKHGGTGSGSSINGTASGEASQDTSAAGSPAVQTAPSSDSPVNISTTLPSNNASPTPVSAASGTSTTMASTVNLTPSITPNGIATESHNSDDASVEKSRSNGGSSG